MINFNLHNTNPYRIFWVFIIFIFSCNSSPKKTSEANTSNDSVSLEACSIKVELEPIKNETLQLKSKDPFNSIIELRGEQLIIDTVIFKVGETGMIAKDNKLLLKNRNYGNIFMLFDLTTMKLIRSFGKLGRGPNEFNYPHIFPTTNTDLIAYAFDEKTSTAYSISYQGEIAPSPYSIPKEDGTFSSVQPGMIDKNAFYYVKNSPSGKSIYKAEIINESIEVSEVQSLSLDAKRKGWANYIGDFAISPSKKRMVYAYKYFKIVNFYDIESNTVRSLNFEREEFDENTRYFMDGLDKNITHYWGISAQDEHVYLLYSGRTPYDVVKEQSKGEYYIYVEKYDWNGNPVAKYKLDHWGYFTVDEKNKTLYLASTHKDDPIIRYILP